MSNRSYQDELNRARQDKNSSIDNLKREQKRSEDLVAQIKLLENQALERRNELSFSERAKEQLSSDLSAQKIKNQEQKKLLDAAENMGGKSSQIVNSQRQEIDDFRSQMERLTKEIETKSL